VRRPRLARWLSGGLRFFVRRFGLCGIFSLHSFQEQTQSASGKDIGAAGHGRVGGNLSNLFQNAFLLFGQLTPRAKGKFRFLRRGNTLLLMCNTHETSLWFER
jgi:hypothetical protein